MPHKTLCGMIFVQIYVIITTESNIEKKEEHL